MRVLATLLLLLSGCNGTPRDIAREYPPETTALETAGGAGLPFFVGKDMRPSWSARAARHLDPFALRDQLDRPTKLDTFRGKVVVASFFFSHCGGVCPLTMRNMQRLQRAFAEDDRVRLVSFSVTPEADTPEVLREYGRRMSADAERWRLLTGDRATIYRIARESFDADTRVPGKSDADFVHSEHLYLLDAEARLRGVYLGKGEEAVDAIVRDAQTLLAKAAR